MVHMGNHPKKRSTPTKSDEHYKTLIIQASDAFVISDSDGNILETNDTASGMFGYTCEDFAAMSIRDLYAGEELQERPFQYEDLLRNKVIRTERTIVCKNGGRVPVEVTVKLLSDGRFMAILRDISERREVEGRLRSALEQYDLLARATSDTTWDWDIVRNSVVYNSGLRNTFGYDLREVADAQRWIEGTIHPEDLVRVRDAFHEICEARISHLQIEYRFRCADGRYKFIYNRCYLMYDGAHRPVRMIGAMQDVTQAREEEKRMAKAILDAQEKERLHLGEELHDNINQILAFARLALETVDEYFPNEPRLSALGEEDRRDLIRVRELIGESVEGIGLAINEIRKLSHHLAPAAISDARLKDVLADLLHRANVQNRYVIEFRFDDKVDCIADDNLIINLFRIAQEQLKNIVKHAEARRIIMDVAAHEEGIRLSIHDDGRGFDPRMAIKGIGLNNIKKRIESLSGKFILNSAPGKGCTITADFPMRNQGPANNGQMTA